MQRDIARAYPQLAGVEIEYAWAGTMGYALHKMPQIGELAPGYWLAGAFGGHGLNTTAMAGEMVARAILDGDDRWRLFSPYELVWAGGRIRTRDRAGDRMDEPGARLPAERVSRYRDGARRQAAVQQAQWAEAQAKRRAEAEARRIEEEARRAAEEEARKVEDEARKAELQARRATEQARRAAQADAARQVARAGRGGAKVAHRRRPGRGHDKPVAAGVRRRSTGSRGDGGSRAGCRPRPCRPRYLSSRRSCRCHSIRRRYRRCRINLRSRRRRQKTRPLKPLPSKHQSLLPHHRKRSRANRAPASARRTQASRSDPRGAGWPDAARKPA